MQSKLLIALLLFSMTLTGCATMNGENAWDAGERNTRLACGVVPIIGCLPNLFFSAGQVISHSGNDTKDTQSTTTAQVKDQKQPADAPNNQEVPRGDHPTAQ